MPTPMPMPMPMPGQWRCTRRRLCHMRLGETRTEGAGGADSFHLPPCQAPPGKTINPPVAASEASTVTASRLVDGQSPTPAPPPSPHPHRYPPPTRALPLRRPSVASSPIVAAHSCITISPPPASLHTAAGARHSHGARYLLPQQDRGDEARDHTGPSKTTTTRSPAQ